MDELIENDIDAFGAAYDYLHANTNKLVSSARLGPLNMDTLTCPLLPTIAQESNTNTLTYNYGRCRLCSLGLVQLLMYS